MSVTDDERLKQDKDDDRDMLGGGVCSGSILVAIGSAVAVAYRRIKRRWYSKG